MALKRTTTALLVLGMTLFAAPGFAELEGMGVIFKQFVEDRQENIRTTVGDLRGTIKQYNLDHDTPVADVQTLKDKGYLDKNISMDRFFGSIDLRRRENDAGEKVVDMIVNPKCKYRRIVRRTLEGFSVDQRVPCEDDSNIDGDKPILSFTVRKPSESLSFSSAATFMLQEDLNKRIETMLERWKGKKVKVISDKIVMNSRKPNDDLKFEHADDVDNTFYFCYGKSMNVQKANRYQPANDFKQGGCDNKKFMNPEEEGGTKYTYQLPRRTYVGFLMVMAVFDEGSDSSEPERVFIPRLVRINNPRSTRKYRLLPIGDSGYIQIRSGYNGQAFRLKLNRLEAGKRVEIVRFISWTPSRQEGLDLGDE